MGAEEHVAAHFRRQHRLKKERSPSMTLHLQRQGIAERNVEIREPVPPDQRRKRKSLRDHATLPGKPSHEEGATSYEQHLVPMCNHFEKGTSESRMTVLVKPAAEDVRFRNKVKLSCSQPCETTSELPVARKTIASIYGKHPHSARVNVCGTYAAIRSELVLETDSLETALVIEFHDVQHKVQMCLDARVFLGQEAIKLTEQRQQQMEAREQEREEMLEVWRRNEEVRVERHQRLLAHEEEREREVQAMREELESIRVREAEREGHLEQLQERNRQRELDREKEREAERACERLRVAEREQMRIREQERAQERAREKARERERQEEITARVLEAAQLAMERQLREEERQLEKERELQRKFELQNEKERDKEWREEMQKMIRMQRICQVCQTRALKEELCETDRRCLEREQHECQRRQRESDAFEALLRARDDVNTRCLLTSTDHHTFHPCNSTHPSLIFADVDIAIPHPKQAVMRAEISEGLCEGDKLDVTSLEYIPSYLVRVAIGRKTGHDCVVLEDVETKMHLGMLQQCPPHRPGVSPSLRCACSEDVITSLQSFMAALCFQTSSTQTGTRVITVTLDAEVSLQEGGTVLVQKQVSARVTVTGEMLAVNESVSYPPKASHAPMLCQDVRLRLVHCPHADPDEVQAFDEEVQLEVNCADGWKIDHCMIGYGMAQDAAHVEEKKRKKDHSSIPYTSAQHGDVYLEGKHVARVTLGDLGDNSSTGVLGFTFNRHSTLNTVRNVLSRLWISTTDDDLRAKQVHVTLSGTTWCTSVVVHIKMLVIDPKCRLSLPVAVRSYRLQHAAGTPDTDPAALWLDIFNTTRLISTRSGGLSFFEEQYEEYFQEGHVEALIIGGSKKGDELSLMLKSDEVALDASGAILHHGVPVATLESQGLLGTKCVRVTFLPQACLSLQLVMGLIRAIHFRNINNETTTTGTRCVGIYATLGAQSLEGQLSVVVGPPLVTAAPTELRQLQHGSPVCLAGEDKTELFAVDDVTNYADMRLRFKVADSQHDEFLEVSRGKGEFFFRAACKDELMLDDEVNLADWDLAEWYDVRALVFARRDEFIALAYSRPGELCIRFKRDPSVAPSSPKAQRSGVSDARSSMSSTASSASLFSTNSSTRRINTGRVRIPASPAVPGTTSPTARKRRAPHHKASATTHGLFHEELCAVLRNVSLVCDAMGNCLRIVTVTAEDALGGVTTLQRRVATIPRPAPCMVIPPSHTLRQRCYQCTPEHWEALANGADFPTSRQVVSIGAEARFADVAPAGGRWKLTAEIVSGRDSNDELVVRGGGIEVDHSNNMFLTGGEEPFGQPFAHLHSRGSLLVEFVAEAAWDHIESVVKHLSFGIPQDPLLDGQRKVGITVQQGDEVIASQHLTVNVCEPLIAGAPEISLVYGLGTGCYPFLQHIPLGLDDDDSLAGGAVKVMFRSEPSPCDEVGLLFDPLLWFQNDTNEIFCGNRPVARIRSSGPSVLQLDFSDSAVGTDLQHVLSRIYYLHGSRHPNNENRCLCVVVSDGTSIQSVEVVIAIQETQESLAVVLHHAEIDFVLKGHPLRIARLSRVIFTGGDRLPGQTCLLLTLLQGATQFDSLSVMLPPYNGSDPRQHPMRVCDRGNLWWCDSTGDSRIGCIEKEKKGFRGLNIKLDAPACRAVEGVLAAVVYVNTRPNLKDRGSHRDVQIILRPGSSAMGTIRPVRKTISVRLVSPLLDEAACFPRKYNSEPVVLLPSVLVPRDCFKEGKLVACLSNCHGTLQVLPNDMLLLGLGSEAEEAGLAFAQEGEEACVVNRSGEEVATVEGQRTHDLAVHFQNASPAEASALLRSVQYYFAPAKESTETPYVSVAVDMSLWDEYGNRCGGVVKVDA